VRQRRALSLALLVALVVPVLGACGLEAQDETSREHTQVQATNFAVGGVQIRDVFVTYPSNAPSRPYIVATLVNDGSSPDTLTGVTTSLGTVTVSGGSLTLPPGVVVNTVQPSPAGGSTLAISTTPTGGTPAAVGTFVPVTFSFATAGTSSQVQVPVVSPDISTTPTSPVPTETPSVPPNPDLPTSD
jgi:hypothetical protein